MKDTLNYKGYVLKFEYDPVNKILEYALDSGFYSNVFQTFNSIIFLLNHGIIPEKIKLSKSCYWYKADPDQDLYPIFFNSEKQVDNLPVNKDLYIPITNRISDTLHYYNFDAYNKIVKKYFYPSDLIIKFEKMYIEKYNIDFDNIIAIYYRGTDKRREIKLANPEEYLKTAKNILSKNPQCRMLVQTDETEVKNYFQTELGNSTITIDDLLTISYKDIGCHPVIKNSSINETKHAVMLDAVIRIISKCKYIVCGAGAVSVAINLYRGTHHNMYRYDEYGKLIYNVNGDFYRNGQIVNCPP